jgi:hypothetical protein
MTTGEKTQQSNGSRERGWVVMVRSKEGCAMVRRSVATTAHFEMEPCPLYIRGIFLKFMGTMSMIFMSHLHAA